ncbi:hypothetical protein ARAM_004774 [Aspergillus rambellii]|uniref:Uncharacterized protein n=1 Tax=Aspergillus rambellii TaxID=308745 RepID=A0A0F8X6J1_9EURO|nr:hypothetical protein ARAM_004774 [Aspergillus rambellii]
MMASPSTTHLSPPFSPPDKASPAAHGGETPSSVEAATKSGANTTSTTKVPTETLRSLPTISRVPGHHHVFLVEDDVATFVKMDLDVSRLNRIHRYLWMAGRPLNARPLQRQKMMGLDVVLTEQADLHLLKFSNKLLLKPLPEYILAHDFWATYLCGSRELHACACGLLLSYVWLVCSPLDLKMAHQLDLLPGSVSWPAWKTLVADFARHVDLNALDQVNRRYHFGELRLGRVNSIYRVRFFFSHFVRGYLYGYNRYVVFFQRNFAWILVVFVYFSLVLSAMQVAPPWIP